MKNIKANKIEKQPTTYLTCTFEQDDNLEEGEIVKNDYIKIKCIRCGQKRYAHKDVNYKEPFVFMAICGNDKKKLNRMLKRKAREDMKDLPQDIISKGKRYLGSRAKWVEAGKPLKNDKTIIYIYDTICSKCEHFTGKSCDICGCRIARSGHNLNKLAWDTENCPDNPPRWKAGETRQDILLRQKKEQMDD